MSDATGKLTSAVTSGGPLVFLEDELRLAHMTAGNLEMSKIIVRQQTNAFHTFEPFFYENRLFFQDLFIQLFEALPKPIPH